MAEENKTYFPLIAIVAIVAIVALVVLLLPARTTTPAVFTQAQLASANSLSDENIAGQAYKLKSQATEYEAYAKNEMANFIMKNNIDTSKTFLMRSSTNGVMIPGEMNTVDLNKYKLQFINKVDYGNEVKFEGIHIREIGTDNLDAQLAVKVCSNYEMGGSNWHVYQVDADGDYWSRKV